jgi:hypothetical protein
MAREILPRQGSGFFLRGPGIEPIWLRSPSGPIGRWDSRAELQYYPLRQGIRPVSPIVGDSAGQPRDRRFGQFVPPGEIGVNGSNARQIIESPAWGHYPGCSTSSGASPSRDIPNLGHRTGTFFQWLLVGHSIPHGFRTQKFGSVLPGRRFGGQAPSQSNRRKRRP